MQVTCTSCLLLLQVISVSHSANCTGGHDGGLETEEDAEGGGDEDKKRLTCARGQEELARGS